MRVSSDILTTQQPLAVVMSPNRFVSCVPLGMPIHLVNAYVISFHRHPRRGEFTTRVAVSAIKVGHANSGIEDWRIFLGTSAACCNRILGKAVVPNIETGAVPR